MTDELNVWRDASDAASENAVKWKPRAEQRAAAVIRSYGDQRDAEGYAQAVADVVAWLNGLHWTHRGKPEAERFAVAIAERFGKGRDHG